MATTDPAKAPTLSDMKIVVRDSDDIYSIVINMADTKRFNSAAGDIIVAYDAIKGNLAGIGGPVESFEVSFTPTDLVAKPHQNSQEHVVEISNVTAEGNPHSYLYTDSKSDEHVELSNITAVGVLTHVNDL